MKKTFEELKIPEAERKFLAGVETQYDSNVDLRKNQGTVGEARSVIFTDTDTGLEAA
ncbi:MAG: hypothetical protein KatS3mg086_010 [Candidatus Dojkabacteria bacterium]|nr:MAG: hypothetical protein KatS3mg086_010 [Candidatus Dojkabacteria bacterium]